MSSTSLDGIIGQNRRELPSGASSLETTPTETGEGAVSVAGEDDADIEGGSESPGKGPVGKSSEEEPTVHHCGWFGVRPRWIQRFMTPKWALFWLCWAGAVQGEF